MEQKKRRTNRRRLRMLGVAAAAAFVGLGSLSLLLGHGRPDATAVAGSGDAPANTVYVQPTQGAMNMGATATFTTPGSVEQSTKAAPPLGSGS